MQHNPEIESIIENSVKIDAHWPNLAQTLTPWKPNCAAILKAV